MYLEEQLSHELNIAFNLMIWHTKLIKAFTLKGSDLGFCQTQTWTFHANPEFSKPAQKQVCESSNLDSCTLSWWFTLVWPWLQLCVLFLPLACPFFTFFVYLSKYTVVSSNTSGAFRANVGINLGLPQTQTRPVWKLLMFSTGVPQRYPEYFYSTLLYLKDLRTLFYPTPRALE